MSPEQVRAEELDTRTDLFSFGVVLYEMATGVTPFRAESTGLIFDAILNRAPLSPGQLNPDMPADLERIIHRALQKDRDLRYQTAAELRDDLKRLKRELDLGHSVATSAFPDALNKYAEPTHIMDGTHGLWLPAAFSSSSWRSLDISLRAR